jgi:hypothetical protein
VVLSTDKALAAGTSVRAGEALPLSAQSLAVLEQDPA